MRESAAARPRFRLERVASGFTWSSPEAPSRPLRGALGRWAQAASDSEQTPRALGPASDANGPLISIGHANRSKFALRPSACGDANVRAQRRRLRRAQRHLMANGPFRGRRAFGPSVTWSDARSIQSAYKNGETKRRTDVLAVFLERIETPLSTARSSRHRARTRDSARRLEATENHRVTAIVFLSGCSP
jgi:hypothetical protein